MIDAIAALAKRFWRIHPQEIQDLGITREQFYEQEMRALLANRIEQLEERMRGADALIVLWETRATRAEAALATCRELREYDRKEIERLRLGHQERDQHQHD
jgi:hypothetical protein